MKYEARRISPSSLVIHASSSRERSDGESSLFLDDEDGTLYLVSSRQMAVGSEDKDEDGSPVPSSLPTAYRLLPTLQGRA